MVTTIYLIRHSKTLKVNNVLSNDDLQLQNEKKCLSIEGEKIAKEKFNDKEFENIYALYSSNYVRTIQTAKYLAKKNNLEINVISDFAERKYGINSWDELPESFESKQFLDENYKLSNGESQKEVRERMYMAIMKILKNSCSKRIAIVSHGTAISYLLKKWCKTEIINDKIRYLFNNKFLFEGNINYCETFKLEFNEDNDIININII